MATYYISPTGNNSNSGSEASPWANLYGIESRSFNPNDTTLMKNGTYAHSASDVPTIGSANGSGTLGNPISLEAYPGHTNVVITNATTPAVNSRHTVLSLQSSYWRIRGLTFRRNLKIGGFGTEGVDDGQYGNEISWCAFNGSDYPPGTVSFNLRPGIYVDKQTDLWIHHNDFSNWTVDPAFISEFNAFNHCALLLYTATKPSSGYIVEDNWFHGNSADIFDKERGEDNHFRRNYFEDGAPFASNNQTGNTNSLFYNNVCNNPLQNIYLNIHNVGTKYYNNILPRKRFFTTFSDPTYSNCEFYNNVFIPLQPDNHALSVGFSYFSGLFAYYDNNVYGGTPVYRFASVNQPVSFMTARGFEQNIATGIALSSVYDTAWALKAPYKTFGRGGTGVGPIDGSGNSIVALIRDTSRYGPTAFNPGAPPANSPPNASFSFVVDGLDVDVDASGSSDIDGTIADPGGYSWNWGDGTANGSGKITGHTYSTAGEKTITLTVTDDDLATDQQQHQMTVGSDPYVQFARARVSPGKRSYVLR